MVSEFLLEASSDLGKAFLNLLHLILRHSLLVQDNIVSSVKDISSRLVTLDRAFTTGDSVVVRWRRSVHFSLISLGMVIEATEVSSQVQVTHFACIGVLELHKIVDKSFFRLLLCL